MHVLTGERRQVATHCRRPTQYRPWIGHLIFKLHAGGGHVRKRQHRTGFLAQPGCSVSGAVTLRVRKMLPSFVGYPWIQTLAIPASLFAKLYGQWFTGWPPRRASTRTNASRNW